MNELFLNIVKIVTAVILGGFLFGVCLYFAGRLFSAGWHISKLKLLRELTLGKENDRESKS